jgi:type I restriction enzyme, S subunit
MRGLPEIHSGKIEVEQHLWREIKKGYTHLADGDVVIAKITPCFENGKAAVMSGLANGVGAGTTELHVVRPLPNLIESTYVYTFLRSPYFCADGRSSMIGTAGQKRLPMQYFATRAFPLPPIAEQKRIVAKVDELIELCDKLESQHERREKLCKLIRKSALANLATADNSDALAVAWNRVHCNLSLWLDDENAITDLRNTVGFLGCRGLLTGAAPFNIADSNYGLNSLPSGWSWKTLKELSEY